MRAKPKLYPVSSILLFLILFSSIASASTLNSTPVVINETCIDDSGSWKNWPAIYQDRIVWLDYHNDSHNIYMCNLSTGKQTQIINDVPTGFDMDYIISIYDDKIVWQDLSNGSYNIHVYDFSIDEETLVTTYKSNQRYPEIYKDRVVWIDDRNGGKNIYMYNLSTSTETQISFSESAESRPNIYGDRIVWADNRSGNSDIYMYDLSNYKETQITNDESDQIKPDIYGDKIVWEDERNGEIMNEYGYISHDVYMYNLLTHEEIQITDDKSDQVQVKIYGDRIVWEERYEEFSCDIYMYDLSTQRETQITTIGTATDPAFYGNMIVWLYRAYYVEDPRTDIYVSTLSPAFPVVSLSSSPITENITSNITSTNKSIPPKVWNWITYVLGTILIGVAIEVTASLISKKIKI